MKKSRCCFSSLSLTLLLFPLLAIHAAPPAAPSNVRVTVLPAEVLLTWDASAGADHYRVYRADLDGLWMPIATQLTVPRHRDTDFRSLPCYYQIAACNAAGECAATVAFTVNPATSAISLVGARSRPLSDTSVSIAWTLQGTGGGNALLEVGTSLNNLQLVGVNPAMASRHEFAVANLAPNTAYYYRLTSAGANGAGFTYTDQFSTRPYTPPPPVVVRLSDPLPPTLVTDEDVPVDFTLTAVSPLGLPIMFWVAYVPFGNVSGTPPNLTYLSGPERNGLDFFDCGYSDGTFTAFKTVFVNVNVVPDPPIALDRSITVTEDVGGRFLVQATDWDSAPTALDCLIVDGTTNGILTKVPFERMALQYIPNPNFNGVDHFTFRCTDGQRTGNAATVRLRVAPANDPPSANPQTVTVFRNTSQTIALDSSDPDGDQLSCVVLSGPAHGALSGPTPNLTGQVTYTPTAGYTGPDSFTWQVTDPSGSTASASVSIDVVRGNEAPTANAASVSTVAGVAVSIVLAGADADGDALIFSVLTLPGHGTLSGVVPNLVYTPAAGYVGADSFTFKASDGLADSAPATVSIDVLRGNQAPTAQPMAVSTVSGVSVNVPLTGSDPDGDALTFGVVTLPAHGTLSGVAPNLVYTPAAGYVGVDSFAFKASDGQADSAAATVSVDVLRGNQAPTAHAASVSTVSGVSVSVVLTGSDPDGDPLTFGVVTLPAHGTLSGVGPNLVYSPAAGYVGADSFTFKVNDGQADSAAATVSVNVLRGNLPPTAQGSSVSTQHGMPVSVVLTGSDPDGDSLTFGVVTRPGHGTLSGVAPNLVYTPAAGYSGADSFTFKVNDGQVDSAPATVTLSVGPVLEPPCAVTGLSAVGVSDRRINLSWTDQCGRETGFRIERSKQENGRQRWEVIATVGANVTSYTDTSFNGRRTFYYRVCALNDSGSSAYSNVASASAGPTQSSAAQQRARR